MLNTTEARIETCTICNYQCIFCPNSTSNFIRHKEIMSYKTFCYILDKIKKTIPQITNISISGFGEPFLDPTIMKKIQYCKSNDYSVHIITNGSLLTFEIIDELNRLKIKDIRISLHSINYKSYIKITNSSKKVHDNLLKSIDYIYKKTNIPIILTFDIIKNINDNEIKDIKKLYNSVATIEIWNPHNWVDTYDFRTPGNKKSTCGRPWNSPLQIQVDGTINMCCFDYNGKLLLGDFLNQTYEEIFNDKPYKNLKFYHEFGDLNNSKYICKNCDQRMDKSNIIIYNNKFDTKVRINKTSTNYTDLLT